MKLVESALSQKIFRGALSFCPQWAGMVKGCGKPGIIGAGNFEREICRLRLLPDHCYNYARTVTDNLCPVAHAADGINAAGVGKHWRIVISQLCMLPIIARFAHSLSTFFVWVYAPEC